MDLPSGDLSGIIQRLFVEHRKPIPLTDIYDRARAYYRTKERKPTKEEFEEMIDDACAGGEIYEVKIPGVHDRCFVHYKQISNHEVKLVLQARNSFPADKVADTVKLYAAFQKANYDQTQQMFINSEQFLKHQLKEHKRFLNIDAERFENEVLKVGVQKHLLSLISMDTRGVGYYFPITQIIVSDGRKPKPAHQEIDRSSVVMRSSSVVVHRESTDPDVEFLGITKKDLPPVRNEQMHEPEQEPELAEIVEKVVEENDEEDDEEDDESDIEEEEYKRWAMEVIQKSDEEKQNAKQAQEEPKESDYLSNFSAEQSKQPESEGSVQEDEADVEMEVDEEQNQVSQPPAVQASPMEVVVETTPTTSPTSSGIQPTRISARKKIKKDLGSDYVAWHSGSNDYDQSALYDHIGKGINASTVCTILRCLVCATNVRRPKTKEEPHAFVGEKIFCFTCDKKVIHARCLPMTPQALGACRTRQFFCNRCKSCNFCSTKNDTTFLIECVTCAKAMHPTCQPTPASPYPNTPLLNAIRSWECYMCTKKRQQQPKVLAGVKSSGQSLLLRPITSKEAPKATLIGKNGNSEFSLVPQHLRKHPSVFIVPKADSARQGASLLKQTGKTVSMLAQPGGKALKLSSQPNVVHNISTGGVSLLQMSNSGASRSLPLQSLLTSAQPKTVEAKPRCPPCYLNFPKFVKERKLHDFLPMPNTFEKKLGQRMLDSLPANVLDWSEANVSIYLKLWGHGFYSPKFTDRQIAGKEMLNLDVLGIAEWGIPMGVAIKIHTAINCLRHPERDMAENVLI